MLFCYVVRNKRGLIMEEKEGKNGREIGTPFFTQPFKEKGKNKNSLNEKNPVLRNRTREMKRL